MFVSKEKYNEVEEELRICQHNKGKILEGWNKVVAELGKERKENEALRTEIEDLNAVIYEQTTEIAALKVKYTEAVQKNFELAEILENLKEKNTEAKNKKFWSKVCTACGYQISTNSLFSNCPRCGAKVEEHR